MSTFIIQVSGAAYGSAAPVHALAFAKAAIAGGHQILRVFFYQDGVFNTSSLGTPASDEFNVYQAWREFSREYSVPLVNCISAALRRGMLSKEEADIHGLPHWNVDDIIDNGGLGELITGIAKADRLMCF
ncbi:sulfurtransferase complex subunit TusD [Shewanella sp. JM162201]|uniref:Sulfurtransferase complex subunit TusD n=1 Tax=Shewanella jiangmenensis TaxID=2837387 RepID=A0ABS5V6U3_9GAMM|nr:sulfurtransferase complex subunit TusD [Shewanella jiangmenensis]MBT1445444.1 sulfurtransferase complex subunit TusD [Shewanella jiangmenensis]